VRVGAHERHGHRHLRTVGEQDVVALAELLDDAEDVVPAAGVQRRRMLAQLPEDLVHLEGGENGLDEDGGLDRAAVEPERVLGERERARPEPCLEVALELGQIEVRAASARELAPGAVKDVEAEIEEARGDRYPTDLHVPFGQVPPAGSYEKRRPIL